MDSFSAQLSQAWLPRFSRIAAVVVAIIGSAVLLGWAIHLALLIKLRVHPLMALLFLASSAALWRAGTPKSRELGITDWLVFVTGLTVCLAASAVLINLYSGLLVPTDLLVFPGFRKEVGRIEPALRMSPNTAVSFILMGVAIALVDVRTRNGFRPAQALALVALAMTLLALVGYAYKVPDFYELGSAGGMTLVSAIAFGLLLMGLLAARPTKGIMAIATSHTMGGLLARRLLPIAVLMPFGVGLALLYRNGPAPVELRFAVGVFSVLSIVVFVGLSWWNSALLCRSENERQSTDKGISLHQEVTRIIAEAATWSDAAPRILECIARVLRSEFGAVWKVDSKAGVLRCSDVWSDSASPLEEFGAVAHVLLLKPGEDLPGRAWETGRTLWVGESALKEGHGRGGLAAHAGFRSGLAVPFRAGTETIGVLEFCANNPAPPEGRMLDLLASVGGLIALFYRPRVLTGN